MFFFKSESGYFHFTLATKILGFDWLKDMDYLLVVHNLQGVILYMNILKK